MAVRIVSATAITPEIHVFTVAVPTKACTNSTSSSTANVLPTCSAPHPQCPVVHAWWRSDVGSGTRSIRRKDPPRLRWHIHIVRESASCPVIGPSHLVLRESLYSESPLLCRDGAKFLAAKKDDTLPVLRNARMASINMDLEVCLCCETSVAKHAGTRRKRGDIVGKPPQFAAHFPNEIRLAFLGPRLATSYEVLPLGDGLCGPRPLRQITLARCSLTLFQDVTAQAVDATSGHIPRPMSPFICCPVPPAKIADLALAHALSEDWPFLVRRPGTRKARFQNRPALKQEQPPRFVLAGVLHTLGQFRAPCNRHPSIAYGPQLGNLHACHIAGLRGRLCGCC
jgi:hypothetical protein